MIICRRSSARTERCEAAGEWHSVNGPGSTWLRFPPYFLSGIPCREAGALLVRLDGHVAISGVEREINEDVIRLIE